MKKSVFFIFLVYSIIACFCISPVTYAANSASQSIVLNGNYMLKSDGTVWMLGSYEYYSSFSLSKAKGTIKPVQIKGAGKIIKIYDKGTRLLAVDQSGKLWHFDYENSKKTTFTQIGSVKDAVDVSSTYWDTYYVKKDGTVWGWGKNNDGFFGDSEINEVKPVQLEQFKNIVSLAAAVGDLYAVTKDGLVWAMYNDYNGDKEEVKFAQVQGIKDVISISPHFYGCVVLTKSGEVYEIDSPYREEEQEVVKIKGLTNVKYIDGGGDDYSYNSTALTKDGKVYVWGNEGTPSSTFTLKSPVEVKGLSGSIAISTNNNGLNVLAVGKDGSLKEWDCNQNSKKQGTEACSKINCDNLLTFK